MDAVFDKGYGAVAAIMLTWILVALISSGRRRHLPPGPRGWPIIGNVFDIPKLHAWKTFADWSKRWGKFHSVFSATRTF